VRRGEIFIYTQRYAARSECCSTAGTTYGTRYWAQIRLQREAESFLTFDPVSPVLLFSAFSVSFPSILATATLPSFGLAAARAFGPKPSAHMKGTYGRKRSGSAMKWGLSPSCRATWSRPNHGDCAHFFQRFRLAASACRKNEKIERLNAWKMPI